MKNKFMVVSGFLGAGKTTSMIAFAEYLNKHGKKASIIANDLGAKNLVDSSFTSTTDCSVTEITGDCICYQTENLVDKLRRLRDVDNAQITMSDIPGCGVGALDHVYHKLNKEYPGEFDLAPFIVITDPERLKMIMPQKEQINLPEEMVYLLNSQIEEADAIVLNKIDLLSDEETDKYVKFLETNAPNVPVFPISAKEHKNIAAVVDYIMNTPAKLKEVDIGYGGEEFVAAEKKLSWYNRRFFVKREDDTKFDGNEFIDDYINEVRKLLIDNKRNVPHLKTFAVGGEDDSGKSSLIGVDYDILHDKKIKGEYSSYRVIVNARAVCESELLADIMEEALDNICKKYNVKCHTFFIECFGMMDEGRS